MLKSLHPLSLKFVGGDVGAVLSSRDGGTTNHIDHIDHIDRIDHINRSQRDRCGTATHTIESRDPATRPQHEVERDGARRTVDPVVAFAGLSDGEVLGRRTGAENPAQCGGLADRE
jgi:hypothetical protein